MDAVLCPKCFYRIVDITKPCAHCGCSVEEINAAIKRREEESTKAEKETANERIQRLIQEGKAMRCPSCNTILNNVYKNCLSCGYVKKLLLEKANNQHLIISSDGTLIGRKTEDDIRKEQEEKEQQLIEEGKAIRCPSCNSILNNVNNPCPQCGCTDGLLQKAQNENLIIREDGTIDGRKTKEMLLNDDKAIKCPRCGTILTNVYNECPSCYLTPDWLQKEADKKQLCYSDDGVITGLKEEVRLLREEEKRKREEEERKRQEELLKEEERRIEKVRIESEASSKLEKLGEQLLTKYYSESSPSRAILYHSSPNAFKGAINMIGGNRGGYGITMMPKVWVLRSHVGQEYFIPVSTIAYVLVYAHQGFMDIATSGAGFDSKTRNQATNPTFNVAISNSDVDRIKKAVKYCMSINNSDIDIQERNKQKEDV